MRVTDQQSVKRVQFTRQEKALRSIPPQVQGCQDSDHHLHVLHSLYFYHGYNLGCYSLLNVCSSEVDKLLLRRNWSISNESEQEILFSANNCIKQVLKGDFRLLYITPKGLIPYTQHLNIISSLEQEKILFYKERFKINHLHFCKFK